MTNIYKQYTERKNKINYVRHTRLFKVGTQDNIAAFRLRTGLT